MRLIVSAAFVVSLTLPAFVSAQSLGEAAAKERERREKLEKEGKSKASPKVFTENDLRGRAASSGTVSQPGSGTSTETKAEGQGTPAATPEGGEKKEKTDDERRLEQEQAWRDKVTKARQDIVTQTDRVNRLQTSLNDVSGNLYGASRTSLLNQLEGAKKELAAAQQRVTDLEEEGRRSGFR
jgi:hypothetical protein